MLTGWGTAWVGQGGKAAIIPGGVDSDFFIMPLRLPLDFFGSKVFPVRENSLPQVELLNESTRL